MGKRDETFAQLASMMAESAVRDAVLPVLLGKQLQANTMATFAPAGTAIANGTITSVTIPTGVAGSALAPASEVKQPPPVESPDEAHHLHDDMGLHDFETMYAKLSDGRLVEVVIGEDGHPQIIGIVSDDGQPEVLQPGEDPSERFIAVPDANGNYQMMLKPDAPRYNGTDTNANNVKQDIVNELKRKGGRGAGNDEDVKEAVGTGKRASVGRDHVFQAKLASIMNDNQFDRRLRGRPRGKLDMSRLPKTQTGSRSVYSQKSLRRNKKYNVTLIVDHSGSMFDGTRIQQAAGMAQFLAEHLKRIPGIEMNIIGYGSMNNQVVWKHFNDDKTKLSHLKSRMVQWDAGGTATGHALELAYQLLKKQPEGGQNIFLVITDGQSEGTSMPMPVINAHRGVASVIGVLISPPPPDSGWTPELPKSFPVQNINDLKPALLGILQREIRRG